MSNSPLEVDHYRGVIESTKQHIHLMNKVLRFFELDPIMAEVLES